VHSRRGRKAAQAYIKWFFEVLGRDCLQFAFAPRGYFTSCEFRLESPGPRPSQGINFYDNHCHTFAFTFAFCLVEGSESVRKSTALDSIFDFDSTATAFRRNDGKTEKEKPGSALISFKCLFYWCWSKSKSQASRQLGSNNGRQSQMYGLIFLELEPNVPLHGCICSTVCRY
jgi:hypothetical protein